MSFSFLLISGHTSLPFFNSQAVETMHSSTYMLCVLYKVSNTTINMSLKSCLRFRQLFGTKKYRCCFFKLCSFSSPFLSSPLSHLVTSCLFFFFFFPSLLTSSSTAPGSGQSSLCLLYLLSHLVKNLSGQPSDWPLGPAGDEAILILSGITAKLVVFSSRTVAAE